MLRAHRTHGHGGGKRLRVQPAMGAIHVHDVADAELSSAAETDKADRVPDPQWLRAGAVGHAKSAWTKEDRQMFDKSPPVVAGKAGTALADFEIKPPAKRQGGEGRREHRPERRDRFRR